MEPPRKRTPPRPQSELAEPAPEHEVDRFASEARYRASRYHRHTTTRWRPDKSKCPSGVGRESAKALLLRGIRRSMFSSHRRGGWPQKVWAVDGGVVYEAQLTNRGQGEYHGYPMKPDDRFAQYLAVKWDERA